MVLWPPPAGVHEVLRREIQLVSLRSELSRELAKFFFGVQIERVAACGPAPSSESPKIAGGHSRPPKNDPPPFHFISNMLLTVPVAAASSPFVRNEMISTAIRRNL
jgi:hypothetical protein